MKKIFMLFAALAAFTACSNDDIAEDKSQNQTMTFRATMEGDEGDAESRASIAINQTTGNHTSVVWDEGDEISVLVSGAKGKMTLSSGAGTKNATFTGSCRQDDYYVAVYPYNENHSYVIGNAPKIYWNGAQQTAVEGSFPKNTPMIAQASVTEESPNVDLKFKNVCSFVKVTTNYPCSKITLKSKSGILVAESLPASFNINGVPEIDNYYTTNHLNYVNLTGAEGATLAAGTYYIAVLPGTHESGFDLTITSAYDDRTWTKSTSKSVTFTRGHVLNLGTMDIKSEFVKLYGEGTAENPFLINDYDQLCYMRDWINSGQHYNSYYKQTRDINGGGKDFTPIGCIGTIGTDEPHRFNGTYDGGGFIIKNIKPTTVRADEFNNYINTKKDIKFYNTSCFASALFAFVLDATIKNLTVENVEPGLSGSSDKEKNYIKSPLVAIAYSSENSSNNIENVTIKGVQTVHGYCDYYTYGGLVAISTSNLNITNCTNYVSISCQPDATSLKIGGLVGLAIEGHRYTPGSSYDNFDCKVNINKCRNYGDFTLDFQKESRDYSWIGGIIGIVSEDTGSDNVITNIINCVNFGDLEIKRIASSVQFGCVGGIVGEMDSDGNISNDPYIQNCVSNGSIKSCQYAGGILGVCCDNDTRLINCANTGTLLGQITGSVVANNKGTLSGCDTKSTLDEYISAMNKNRPGNYCAWKYVAGTNNTKIDLDF